MPAHTTWGPPGPHTVHTPVPARASDATGRRTR